jgi:hypothetical protein
MKRRNPGIKGKRPDRKKARRDLAITNAKARGDSPERIAKLYAGPVDVIRDYKAAS